MLLKKPKLKIGREYEVPIDVARRANAKFIGTSDEEHVFVSEQEGEKRYIFMMDGFTIEYREGVIGYSPLASLSPTILTKNNLEDYSNKERLSHLLKILNKLGQEVPA